MWLSLSITSALIFGSAGWFMKMSQMKNGSVSVLLIWLYIIGTIGFGVHAIVEKSYVQLANPYIWLAGFIIGIGSALGNYLFMKALELGPASLTSPLSNTNIVLVVLMGTWMYNEPLGIMQMISIALLLIATVLITQKKESRTITSNWWYGLLALAVIMFALRNGGLKVTAELGFEAAPVLFVAYLLSVLFFIFPALQEQRQTDGTLASASFDHLQQTAPSAVRAKADWRVGMRYGMISGLCSYGGLQLYAVALQNGPANLVAPIFATNGLLVSLLSILIYKERLNKLQWLAFIFLLLGLVTIRITGTN